MIIRAAATVLLFLTGSGCGGRGARLGEPPGDHMLLQVASEQATSGRASEDDGPCRQDCPCWERWAGSHTCGSRISWVARVQADEYDPHAPQRAPSAEALAFAAALIHDEFPIVCTCPTLTANAYYRAEGVGSWGGWCTCPDGQRYTVGDRYDACAQGPASLACEGGTPGECIEEVDPSRQGMKVTCAPPRNYLEPQGGRPDLSCTNEVLDCCGRSRSDVCELSCPAGYALQCDSFSPGSGSSSGVSGAVGARSAGTPAVSGGEKSAGLECPKGWRLQTEWSSLCCRCAHSSVIEKLPQPCRPECRCWKTPVLPGSWSCGNGIQLLSGYVWDAPERIRRQFPQVCTCSAS